MRRLIKLFALLFCQYNFRCFFVLLYTNQNFFKTLHMYMWCAEFVLITTELFGLLPAKIAIIKYYLCAFFMNYNICCLKFNFGQ